MLIDGLLFWFVARHLWGWTILPAATAVATFVVVDGMFLAANFLKVLEGGWFPLLVGAFILALMTTWRQGRRLITTQIREATLPCDAFIGRLDGGGPMRVKGTAVFLTGNREGVPYALLHNLKHNKVLHERIVLLTVRTLDVPFAPAAERRAVEDLGKGFWRVTLSYGFKESPDVPRALAETGEAGGAFDLMQTSFFLGRERLVPTVRTKMTHWREMLYILLQRNQVSATDFFQIPPGRVVELGTQIEI
jgi:KUP system potassium uptake protein